MMIVFKAHFNLNKWIKSRNVLSYTEIIRRGALKIKIKQIIDLQ